MKYKNQILIIFATLIMLTCSKEEMDILPMPEEEIPAVEYHCDILAQVRGITLVDGSTGETTTLFDTLHYIYDQDDRLVKKEIGSVHYDSLVYENEKLRNIYRVENQVNVIRTSELEIAPSGHLIRSMHQGDNWYGVEVDSFFYDTNGRIEKILTYREYYFNVQQCDDLTLKQELIFVFDDNDKLLQDTIRTYDDCDENLRLRDLTITSYSDHTTVKNPFFQSLFREHHRTAFTKFLIGTQSYTTYTNGSQSANGHFSVAPDAIEKNEFGYPKYGYLFECEAL